MSGDAGGSGGDAVGPVRGGARDGSLDVLRGVAILGILMVNIGSFALPESVFYRPSIAGGFEGVNYAVWWLTHVLFELKFIGIFSMLFGVGALVLTTRIESRGGSSMGVYYRRLAVLFVIGMVHAYGLWHGDVLVAYALCGLLLWPMRKLAAGWLWIIAGFLLVGFVVANAVQGGLVWLGMQAAEAQPNDPMSAEILAEFYPTPEMLADEIAMYRGGYGELFVHRAWLNLYYQIGGVFAFTPWRVLSVMLIGMALWKMGFFARERGASWYLVRGAVGYVVGLPSVALSAWLGTRSEFEPVTVTIVCLSINGTLGLLVAFGHVCMVLAAVRWVRGAGVSGAGGGARAVGWLVSRLEAVGRMALTNYLLTTVVCCFVFYGMSGLGLGLFGSMERWQLALVVLTIWTAQVLLSRVYLSRFEFGPAEWAWRRLTYGVAPGRAGGGGAGGEGVNRAGGAE